MLGLIDTMSVQVERRGQAEIRHGAVRGLRQCRTEIRTELSTRTASRSPAPAPAGSTCRASPTMPQSELGAGASRFQLYANLGQTWPGCVETRYSANKDYDVDDTPPDPRKVRDAVHAGLRHRRAGYARLRQQLHHSDAKPKDKSRRAKRRSAGQNMASTTDASGQPAAWRIARSTSSLHSAICSAQHSARRRSRSTPARPSTTASPKGPGHGCDVQPITPMTSDYDGLKAKVNALQANGTTNIMEGVAWGNRVLSPGQPFSGRAARRRPGWRRSWSC